MPAHVPAWAGRKRLPVTPLRGPASSQSPLWFGLPLVALPALPCSSFPNENRFAGFPLGSRCANRKWGKNGKGARPLSTPYPRGVLCTPSFLRKGCSRDPLSSRKRSCIMLSPTAEPTRSWFRRGGVAKSTFRRFCCGYVNLYTELRHHRRNEQTNAVPARRNAPPAGQDRGWNHVRTATFWRKVS